MAKNSYYDSLSTKINKKTQTHNTPNSYTNLHKHKNKIQKRKLNLFVKLNDEKEDLKRREKKNALYNPPEQWIQPISTLLR